MPKNKQRHQLDAVQCQKLSFDPGNDAIRVVNVLDSQTNLEISAEQGDSIQSVARAKVIKPEDGPVDCSSMRKVCCFGQATVAISADGEVWSYVAIQPGIAIDICAMQIKVTNGSAVVRS